ncbi:MAG TPA: hypothetical protein PKN96_08270 [Flavobacterium sp.]|uniref:hypothetical protein n=1 Tax=Flavobacterium sp. TaxID=239 RepID=UPI002BA23F7F|nr:hypothetical protein [Flavobacterium sp.]HNP33273.1 hypothetical protein [Flavobacterium sp.]
MKKFKLLILILPFFLILVNCNSAKKTAMEAKPVENPVSYKTDIAPMMTVSCTPCHFPPQGRKEPLDNYEHVKSNIKEVIKLVKLPVTDPDFMPFKSKKPALTSEQIATLEKWQQQGMPE